MSDKRRVRELLRLDFLTYPQWVELRDIVDRNQDNGVFNERTWNALRDWCNAVRQNAVKRSVARNEVEGS